MTRLPGFSSLYPRSLSSLQNGDLSGIFKHIKKLLNKVFIKNMSPFPPTTPLPHPPKHTSVRMIFTSTQHYTKNWSRNSQGIESFLASALTSKQEISRLLQYSPMPQVCMLVAFPPTATKGLQAIQICISYKRQAS